MCVIFKEGNNSYIGELDKRITLNSGKTHKEIRGISDVNIDITNLIKALMDHKDKIEKIRLKVDERILFVKDGQETKIENALSGLKVETINF
jgi:CRISPR-associated protein Csh2